MSASKGLSFQRHPDPQLQPLWDGVQIAVLLLPFSSLISSVAISVISLIVLKLRFGKIVRRPVNWGFAVVGGFMLVSAILAYRRADALLGLANFLPFFIVFAALSELLQTPAQLRRIAWLLVIGSVPVVLIGLGQQFWGWAGHVQLLGSVVDWKIDPTGNPPGRMASIFFFANILASYLVVTFTLGLGLLVEVLIGRAEAKSQRHTRDKPGLIRCRLPLALALIVLGNAIALVLTNSRNVWAIAVFTCLAFAVYLRWRWLLTGVMVVAGSILGAAFAPSPGREWLRVIVPAFFWARLTDELYPNRPIADVRTTQWQFAWSLVQQRPWMGWGLRNFSLLYQDALHAFIGHPHNLPLMLAAETGLPATVLFLVVVGWIVAQAALYLWHWPSAVTVISERLAPLAAPIRADISPSLHNDRDRLLFFTYFIAFLGCTLFSLLDITLFDVRINTLGWLLLAAICGVVTANESSYDNFR